MTKAKGYDEFTLINWIRQHVRRGSDVLIGIGDDAAHLECSGGSFVATTDMLLEGTHFDAAAGWKLIGRKALAVSLSDMAAMAARPRFALCAVGLSDKLELDDAKNIFRGMQELAADFGCQIVGGDVTSWTGLTSICVSVFGEPAGKAAFTRSGAKSGDRILVTGELGGSAAGRHMSFLPRVVEAIYLSQNYTVHSCIDISDGFGLDLNHILEESGVGALVYEDAIPVSTSAIRASVTSGKTPLEHALSDGEDFELLLTMPPKEAERLLADRELGTAVSIVGGITPGGFVMQGKDGKIRKYKPEGYAHFRK